jgi:hypothetical protein
MDFREKASSNLRSNIVSEIVSTDLVEAWSGLQAEAAGDDLLLDIGGAAEDRLHVAIRLGSGSRRTLGRLCAVARTGR